MKISICPERNTIRTITAIGLLLLACSTAQSRTNTSPWSFVSSPDWFNQDIADLSGSTNDVMKAPGWDNHVSSGGTNGVSDEMVTVYDTIVTEMASYTPEAIVITGDLINGVWFKDETLLDMFDPSTRNRATAINNAASIYYGWQKQLFASNGIDIVLGAIGDHEIGDDDWPEGSEKASHVTTMKQAFSENMVDPLGLPAQINGVSSRPPTGTGYEYGNYAYQLNNVLFITVDVWRQDNPATVINEHYRSVSPEVTTAVLDWLDDILDAADTDATIDHVIVQGHTPVLRPVRMQLTSGTLLVDREDSGFWQVLRQHDHKRGGKVRFYFCGEVHTITATKDLQSDIIQLVHGNPPIAYGPLVDIPGTTHGNFAAFTVHPDRIEVDMRRFELQSESGGSSIYWQANNPATPGPSTVSQSQSVGTLAIDTSGIDTTYQQSGWLEFVDYKSLVVNFDFDQTVASGNYSNSGSIGNLYYEGRKTGNVTASPGMFGNGILLDGSTGYIESGRGNITDGESRTVTGWIKTGSGGARPILSYGTNKTGINGRFEFRLMNGRPELRIASSIICKPGSTPLINDNSWHHVAIVLPNDHSNTCADVLFYIDGQQYPSGTNYASASINTVAWGFYRIGRNEFGSSEYFNGSIDDISVWGAPLTSAEVRALANAGTHPYLHYDALDMEMLLDQFNSGQGITNVGTNEWQSVTGLTGNGGDILTLNGNIAIQLDDLGNGIVSDIAAPVGPALLEDDFNDGDAAGWTLFDNCPYSAADWDVRNNVLMQTNNCFGFSRYGIPLGTYQLSATTLTGDVDIQVQLRAEDPSTDPVTSNNDSKLKFGSIGMLFGYQDANNYYRFDLNARNGYRKLWRVQGGTFTELVTSPQGYVGDQWMDLRIIHQNGVILIFIDGIQVMAAADATYSSGKIAFFCAVNPNCSFDNLVVTTAPDDPMPGINLMDSSSPAHASGEYFVTPGNTLDVVGMTTVTTGIGGIEFVLDEGTGSELVQTDLTPPYSSQFDSLAPGEHTLTAYLLDTSAARLTAGTASVTMPRIGTGGIHLHAIGDSITFGLLDDIAADDISSDSRNIGGGYTPVLNNFLSAFNSGRPVTVTNDGISGERTAEGADRIDTVLARTPAAQAYLIGYGTNDSGSMPLDSGFGLDPDHQDYPGTYKYYLQQIIDAVVPAPPAGAGKPVFFAKTPPYLNNAISNGRIEEFNEVIDELVAQLKLDYPSLYQSYTPPDFHSYFTANPAEITSDNIHPNGTGYQSMGRLWCEALNGLQGWFCLDDDDDRDGLVNSLEAQLGTDPLLADTDGDGLVDGDDGLVPVGNVPGGVDNNGDGFVDGELDYATDPLLADSDDDRLNDGLEVAYASDPLDPGSWPALADGDIAPLGAPDGEINAGDILVATRIVLGLEPATALELAHGDLYPPGSPDGKINLQDLILLRKLP